MERGEEKEGGEEMEDEEPTSEGPDSSSIPAGIHSSGTAMQDGSIPSDGVKKHLTRNVRSRAVRDVRLRTDQEAVRVRKDKESWRVREDKESLRVREDKESLRVREDKESSRVREDKESLRVREDKESLRVREDAARRSCVCDVCGKDMRCRSMLLRHAIIHTGQKPHSCHLCSLSFNRLSNLHQHLKRMHPDGVARVERRRASGQRSWLCHVCGKAFNCPSRLKNHAFVHTGARPHPCDMCSKGYMSVSDLRHHKKTVHAGGAVEPARPSSLLCELCGREFKCKSQLSLHSLVHTGERPHVCDLCGWKFRRRHQLKRHQTVVHASRSQAGDSLQCEVCGKQLKSRSLLASHTRSHREWKPHRCLICSSSFRFSRDLKQHQKEVHGSLTAEEKPPKATDPAGPSPFVCKVCGKDLKFRSQLALHSRMHTGEKPHACDRCPLRFSRPGHLKRHKEVVHSRDPKPPQSFVCQVCGKDMKIKSILERHVIIHTGEKPHACQLCSRRFNRRGNLQQHVRTVHGAGKRPSGHQQAPVSDKQQTMTQSMDSIEGSVSYPVTSSQMDQQAVT